MRGQRKSRALDRLITTFDRDLQTSVANTTVQANKRLAGRGELQSVPPGCQAFTLVIYRFGWEAPAWDGSLVRDLRLMLIEKED
jgi:hypothetical protein